MNDKLSVVRPEAGAVAMREPDDANDPLSMIRFAVGQGATPETLAQMMAVRRELRAEQIESAFHTSMAALQAELPPIEKTKGVPSKSGGIAYKFAPFEEIVRIAQPFLLKHGFSYSLDTDTESKDGWVIAKCEVTHSAGFKKTSSAKFPLGAGTAIMSTTQIYAAALTFASRRVFCNAFGIVTRGEDQDGGHGNQPKPAGPSVAPSDLLKEAKAALWQLLGPVRGIAASWVIAEEWMVKKRILAAGRKVSTLTIDEINDAISKAEMALAERGE